MPSSILIIVVIRVRIFVRVILAGFVFACRIFTGILRSIFIRRFCIVHVVRAVVCVAVVIVVGIAICVAVVVIARVTVIRVIVCVVVIFSHFSIPPMILVFSDTWYLVKLQD